jgi:hypothetical protein
MTDVAYQCPYCGSVNEVESIRQNLMLDLRTAASYGLSGRHRILNLRARFLRWRMTRGLAAALWPGIRIERLQPVPVAELPVSASTAPPPLPR